MNVQATAEMIAARRPALAPRDLGMPRSTGVMIIFWSVTVLFCLQIGFTAYAQLNLPVVAEAFAVGDGTEAWGWAAGTAVLWALSYFSWHRRQAASERS